ncbi:MAG: FAD-binding oxidoreductase [Proteobacteria bacterium]|nr:FAD-binding oxidoreductase [Pseudomonadota bacterium]
MRAMNTADVIVLGAGMAGASLAAELAPECRVVLLEVEDQPGMHATGRSAAMFFESYGNAVIRALTRASRAFLERPPEDFADVPLLTPRACLFVADAPRAGAVDALLADAAAGPALRRWTASDACALVPILRPDWVAAAALDDSGHDIDVAALHQGYLRASRRAGATFAVGARDVRVERAGAVWRVRSRAGDFEAGVVVNAAGAWADVVARGAGVPPVGLEPLRRTAIGLPAPAGHDMRAWPLVIDIDEQFYFKPEGAQLLLSPANEDPSPPCDAVPDELDIALAVDRFERATTMPVTRIVHRRAGLRSFVADRTPVVGFDAEAPGFCWLAGQGGYGIQTAPALARSAAALIAGRPLPADVAALGVTVEALAPRRPALASGG